MDENKLKIGSAVWHYDRIADCPVIVTLRLIGDRGSCVVSHESGYLAVVLTKELFPSKIALMAYKVERLRIRAEGHAQEIWLAQQEIIQQHQRLYRAVVELERAEEAHAALKR